MIASRKSHCPFWAPVIDLSDGRSARRPPLQGSDIYQYLNQHRRSLRLLTSMSGRPGLHRVHLLHGGCDRGVAERPRSRFGLQSRIPETDGPFASWPCSGPCVASYTSTRVARLAYAAVTSLFCCCCTSGSRSCVLGVLQHTISGCWNKKNEFISFGGLRWECFTRVRGLYHKVCFGFGWGTWRVMCKDGQAQSSEVG